MFFSTMSLGFDKGVAVKKEEYLRNVYKVVFYIEAHYDSELTLEELSRVAGFSKYHFHRIFKSVIGESVGEFLRRIRLEASAMKLKSDQTITQIAMNSGYETSASFAKAFKNRFGIAPREFSKNAKMKKGLKMLKPKIVDIEPIEVLCVRKTGAYSKSASEAWQSIVAFISEYNLFHKVVTRYAVAHDNPKITESELIRYDACIAVNDQQINPNGEVVRKIIAGGKYAVFMHEGAYETLNVTYDALSNWIIENDVKVDNRPIVQKYLDLDPTDVKPEDLRTEICVPIV